MMINTKNILFVGNSAGTRKTESYGLPVFSSSNAHGQSPLWASDMRFVPEASSRSLHVCEQQKLRRDCAHVQARLSLC